MTFSFGKVLISIGHFFAGAFEGLWTAEKPVLVQFEQNIVAFVKTDIGQLALDAIQLAPTLVPAGADGVALRAAAEAKLAADLIKAGKDATAVTTTSVQLFIATAYAYAKNVIGNLQTQANAPAAASAAKS